MRTTVELTHTQRARFLKLATARGLKSYSGLVREAIDRYLDEEADRMSRVEEAVRILGTLDDQSADRMLETARILRES